MTRQKMFMKMISASLVRRRSRMLVALLAIAVGATILAGLVTIYVDVPRQMGAQFRNYGANMIFVSASADKPLTMEDVEQASACINPAELVGITPYKYDTVRVHEQPIVAAGTSLENAKITSPYWHVEGEWPAAENEVLIGKTQAEFLGLKVGDRFSAVYYNNTETEEETDLLNLDSELKVTGILETGGSEEDYLYMSLTDLNEIIKDDSDRLDLAEVSVSASADKLNSYVEQIGQTTENVAPRLVKRVTQSETTVLSKLQALVFLVTAVVLILTMICVATTMTAVVAERRQEIGLRKALGASDKSIIWEFMGEGMLLGAIGGVIGAILGFVFAQIVSVNVFGSSIFFQPLILPVTIIVSIIVTGIACLVPVRGAVNVDPALVLKGE